MTWTEIRNHPSLQNLPYKIEMSEWGNIEMSPLGVHHRKHQAQLSRLLQELRPDGVSETVAAVETSENVKVPDVVWASRERWQSVPHDLTWRRAPEICVEIVTPDDPPEEGKHKARLYLEAGATEFWISDETGQMRFYDASGLLERSRLCPEFPAKVEVASGTASLPNGVGEKPV